MKNSISKITNNYETRSIEVDGPIFTKFSKLNLEKLSGNHKISLSCIELLSQSHDPTNNYNFQKKVGLAIGKVQSGKTTFFLSAIAMAFDNGFDIATIFTGTKKNLKNQIFL